MQCEVSITWTDVEWVRTIRIATDAILRAQCEVCHYTWPKVINTYSTYKQPYILYILMHGDVNVKTTCLAFRLMSNIMFRLAYKTPQNAIESFHKTEQKQNGMESYCYTFVHQACSHTPVDLQLRTIHVQFFHAFSFYTLYIMCTYIPSCL